MNYNHYFHAGNFADVVKHLILIYIIEYNKLKSKPIVFFDSHAGNGLYDLFSSQSLRSGEYLNGINQIYNKITKISTVYKQIISDCNINPDEIRYYPGSPYIFASLMREQDRLILIEKKLDFKNELEDQMRFFKNKIIHCHSRDGFEALNALLPAQEKRAVILIDPAFEKLTDWQEILKVVSKLNIKFSNAQII